MVAAIPDKNGRVKLVFYFPKSYVALWDNMEIPSDQEVTFSQKIHTIHSKHVQRNRPRSRLGGAYLEEDLLFFYTIPQMFHIIGRP